MWCDANSPFLNACDVLCFHFSNLIRCEDEAKNVTKEKRFLWLNHKTESFIIFYVVRKINF